MGLACYPSQGIFINDLEGMMAFHSHSACRAQSVFGILSDFIDSPEAAELDVFLFRTTPDKRVEIRIDKVWKSNSRRGSLYCIAHFTNGSRDSCSNMPNCDVQLTDKYGSPTLGDLQSVTAAVNSGMLERLGEDAAGEIEVAVSSPVSSTTARMHDTVTLCGPWKSCKSDQPAEHQPYYPPDWGEICLCFKDLMPSLLRYAVICARFGTHT